MLAMEKRDALADKLTMSRAKAASRPPSLWQRHWDLLALIVLVLASMPAAILSPHTLVIISRPGIVDDNWHLDLGMKASLGLWVGRDVAFTHGPLFQWLSTLPARAMGLSMGALHATWDTLPLWCTILFLYFALRMLLPEQPAWKRALLLLLLCIYWDPAVRPAFALLLFAMFLRDAYAVAEEGRNPYVVGAVGAFLAMVAFLLAIDPGMYAVAAWLITVAAVGFELRANRAALRGLAASLASFVVCGAVLMLLINLLMARSLFDFRFWKNSAAIVSVYRWATAYHISDAGTMHLLGTLLAGIVIFGYCALRHPKQKSGLARRTGFLLAGFAMAFVMMQSGLVRSDFGHIENAVLAMVFLSMVALFAIDGHTASSITAVLVIGCSLLFGDAGITLNSVRYQYAQVLHPITSCPDGFGEFDRGCYPQDFINILRPSADYLRSSSREGQSIAIFPYQTMFGLAARRNVAGGLIQPYTASGAYLAKLEIGGLAQSAAPSGLYFPDVDQSPSSGVDIHRWSHLNLSVPVDGVSNFTRTPEVWFWLMQHYRAVQQLAPGVVALARDGSRAARITQQAQPIGLSAQTYPVTERSTTLSLGSPGAWPANADFLRVRLTVHDSVLWKLRKPSRLQMEMQRADGSHDYYWFVVEPNVSSEVWFYPWNQPELARYFDADASKWRSGARPAITGLRLWITPLDWSSQQPSAVSIEAADAVHVDMQP